MPFTKSRKVASPADADGEVQKIVLESAIIALTGLSEPNWHSTLVSLVALNNALTVTFTPPSVGPLLGDILLTSNG